MLTSKTKSFGWGRKNRYTGSVGVGREETALGVVRVKSSHSHGELVWCMRRICHLQHPGEAQGGEEAEAQKCMQNMLLLYICSSQCCQISTASQVALQCPCVMCCFLVSSWKLGFSKRGTSGVAALRNRCPSCTGRLTQCCSRGLWAGGIQTYFCEGELSPWRSLSSLLFKECLYTGSGGGVWANRADTRRCEQQGLREPVAEA